MICNWRWFIQPATVISTNRNGSRTLGIWLAHYREDSSRSSFRTIRGGGRRPERNHGVCTPQVPHRAPVFKTLGAGFPIGRGRPATASCAVSSLARYTTLFTTPGLIVPSQLFGACGTSNCILHGLPL